MQAYQTIKFLACMRYAGSAYATFPHFPDSCYCYKTMPLSQIHMYLAPVHFTSENCCLDWRSSSIRAMPHTFMRARNSAIVTVVRNDLAQATIFFSVRSISIYVRHPLLIAFSASFSFPLAHLISFSFTSPLYHSPHIFILHTPYHVSVHISTLLPKTRQRELQLDRPCSQAGPGTHAIHLPPRYHRS